MPKTVPGSCLASSFKRGANGLGLRVDIALGCGKIAVSSRISKCVGVHYLGPPRQAGVPECVECELNLPILHALLCCFLSVDFSIRPLHVGAGNTHLPFTCTRRSFRRAARRSVKGIRLWALDVLPKKTWSAPSRMSSHRRRKHSSRRKAQSRRNFWDIGERGYFCRRCF